MSKACWIGVIAFGIFCFGSVQAADSNSSESASSAAASQSLNRDIDALKADVAELNTALYELEEDVLYPANTQLAVFLSFAAQDHFQLDSIELSVDGRMASSHLYSVQEREALKQGGIQRLYLGNLSPGEHKITATLNGKGANDQYFRKQQTFAVTKDDNAERVELIVQAPAPAYNPSFSIKQWQ